MKHIVNVWRLFTKHLLSAFLHTNLYNTGSLLSTIFLKIRNKVQICLAQNPNARNVPTDAATRSSGAQAQAFWTCHLCTKTNKKHLLTSR